MAGRARPAKESELAGVFSDNVGSRMIVIKARDIRAIEMIAAAARRGEYRAARLKD